MKKLSLLILLSFILLNCSSGDGDKDDNIESVSPQNSNALSEVLVIPNAEIVNSPNVPPPSSPDFAPAVSYFDNNISYSSGSQIILPFNVASVMSSNIAGVYIQVVGASTYFDVPINSNTPSGTFSVPVNLPAIVGNGQFHLILQFYDAMGNISAVSEISITVTSPNGCGDLKVSGGEGLTSTIFDITGGTGRIKIDYDTYTVPDRIDIFQNGLWLGGTGPSTQRSTLRRPLNCDVATVANGYVGQEDSIIVSYDTSQGDVEVVVSGCENGGTAWKYTFSCPEPTPPGQFVFSSTDGNTYSGTCFQYNQTDCSNPDVVKVRMNITNANPPDIYNLELYSVPKASSGTYTFVNSSITSNCNLNFFGPLPGGDIVSYSFGGNSINTITKTGEKSFTFQITYNWSGVKTITGEGSYN